MYRTDWTFLGWVGESRGPHLALQVSILLVGTRRERDMWFLNDSSSPWILDHINSYELAFLFTQGKPGWPLRMVLDVSVDRCWIAWRCYQ